MVRVAETIKGGAAVGRITFQIMRLFARHHGVKIRIFHACPPSFCQINSGGLGAGPQGPFCLGTAPQSMSRPDTGLNAPFIWVPPNDRSGR
jgi:hypothetical protein